MIAQTTRDPWRTSWRLATSDGLLTILLLGLAVGLVIALWLPQMPSTEPVAYAQWLSTAQARFGDATPTMQALGLFSIARSIVFRALLSLLAGCLLLRLIESADRLRQRREIAEPAEEWQPLACAPLPDTADTLRHENYRILKVSEMLQADRWPWSDLFPLLIYGGGLLVLVGLLVTQVWGWQVPGLTLQGGDQVALPGAENRVAMEKTTGEVTHSPGITTLVEGNGPGVQASAFDGAGRSLALQQAAEADPVTDLNVTLTEERYFAVPEAQLIVRLTPQTGESVDVHTPILAQVYRSPPGRLIVEGTVEGDTELTVDEVTLRLVRLPYVRLTATFDPGVWPSGVGLVLLVAGVLGSTAWPARRFWLRETAGRVEGAGHLPPALTKEEEN